MVTLYGDLLRGYGLILRFEQFELPLRGGGVEHIASAREEPHDIEFGEVAGYGVHRVEAYLRLKVGSPSVGKAAGHLEPVDADFARLAILPQPLEEL